MEIFTVGTGEANGVPRPVVNSTICAPEAASAVAATRSLPGALSRFKPFVVTGLPYGSTSLTFAVLFVTRGWILVNGLIVTLEVFFKIVD